MDSFAEFMEMGVSAALARRKSCRNFKAGKPSLNAREYINNAGKTAPYASGGPRRKIMFPMPGKFISEGCFDQKSVYLAPDAWLICGKDPDAILRSGHPKYIFDCSAACMCMDLMAVALGYGTCWIGHFDPDKIKTLYTLEDHLIPVIILLVGRKADD